MVDIRAATRCDFQILFERRRRFELRRPIFAWLVMPIFVFNIHLMNMSSNVSADDLNTVESQLKVVPGSPRMSYYLLPPVAAKLPFKGYGVLVILPGGDGSADFHPFIKRIRKEAVPDDFVVVQPVAVKWSEKQVVVWPTEHDKVTGQEFSTEQFVTSILKEVQRNYRVAAGRVFCMGWSSSGPVVYAMALQPNAPFAAVYPSMSVFKPEQLPPLSNAKNTAIYIEHSPSDKVCPYWMARKALASFKAEHAKVKLVTYQGGHGWRGDVYGRIRRAIEWMSVHGKAPNQLSDTE